MQSFNVKTPATARTGGGTGADVKRAVELTMYKEAPSGEVSVEEFEKYALDRLRGAELITANISESHTDSAYDHVADSQLACIRTD
jgi:hypothetical protein